MDFENEGPVGGVDYPRTYQEFREWFPDDASCAAYLARTALAARLSMSGVPGREGVADLDSALEVRRLRAQDLGDCRNHLPSHAHAAEHVVCGHLAGHLAEERRLGAERARHARPGLLRDRVGVAAQAAPRDGAPRPRAARGVVEVDESFVGGRATGKDGASTDKVPVMIAVENRGTQVNRKLLLGRVRLGVADAPGSLQLVDFARTTAAPGSLIRTDGARMFRVLAEEGFTHEYVAGYKSPEPGHVTLPGPHRVASLLKRWNAGTHHYRVEREHLPYYLDEFTFRFNRRRSTARGMLFYRLLQQSVNTDPHPLYELIGGTTVKLPDEEPNEQTTLEPLPSNTFGKY